MSSVLRLLRPHQWVKNALVFAAPGAAGRLDEGSVVLRSLLAFALFCAISSAGYVRNDMADIDADRQHPVKQYRPLASGEVSLETAARLTVALVALAVIPGALLGVGFVITLVGYAAISSVYTAALKRVPWVELVAVSAGFVLRAVAGGAATDTPISGWFLLVVSAGSLLVITGKRLGEFVTLGGRSASRGVLARYRLDHLRLVAALSASLAVGGYVLWAAAEAEDRAAGTDGSLLLRLTAVPFALAIARYLVLSWRGAGETPESLLLRDRMMAMAGASWVIVYSLGLYQ